MIRQPQITSCLKTSFLAIGVIFVLTVISGCDHKPGREPENQKKSKTISSIRSLAIPNELAGLPLDLKDKPHYFNEENLWEHLDGGAHEIIRIGFNQLAVAYYRQPGTEDELSIQVFTMKSHDAAAKLFDSWRSKEPATGKICGRSVIDGTTLSWQKGVLYVQITAIFDKNNATPRLEQAGNELCKALTSKQAE